MQCPANRCEDRIVPLKLGRFSRTANKVALRRAAHQLFDQPKVLDDPLAVPIVGAEAAEKLRPNPKEHQHPISRAFRAFMAARSRYAEDQLAKAIEERVAQYVVLGAGLDTFAYRNPHAAYLQVFEVDHPPTQAWKLERLQAAGIAIPTSLICPGRFRATNACCRTRTGRLRLRLTGVLLLAGRNALSHPGILHSDPALHRATASGQRRGLRFRR